MKLHVKKGDNVVVIAGKDKGKTGKVLFVNPSDATVVVEGVNFQVKHKKPRNAQDKGGVIKKEGKINSSNVQILDPTTKKATRVYHKLVDGKMVRVSKAGTVLDAAYVAPKKASKKATEKKEKVEEKAEKVEKATKAAPKAAESKAKTTTKKAASASAEKTTATKAAKTTEKKTGTATRTKSVTRVRNQER